MLILFEGEMWFFEEFFGIVFFSFDYIILRDLWISVEFRFKLFESIKKVTSVIKKMYVMWTDFFLNSFFIKILMVT